MGKISGQREKLRGRRSGEMGLADSSLDARGVGGKQSRLVLEARTPILAIALALLSLSILLFGELSCVLCSLLFTCESWKFI